MGQLHISGATWYFGSLIAVRCDRQKLAGLTSAADGLRLNRPNRSAG